MVVYVVTLAILLSANISSVGASLERAQVTLPALRFLLGIMGAATALTFFFMFGMCLYHFSRGYVLDRPATGWLWVILLLNFLGIILYYTLVIEAEHSALSYKESDA